MSTMNICLLGFFLLVEVAPLDGTFTARAEVYTEKDVVVQCEDPKKFGSHYHWATIEGECTRMNKMNCHVVVKVAPRGVFQLPMKDKIKDVLGNQCCVVLLCSVCKKKNDRLALQQQIPVLSEGL